MKSKLCCTFVSLKEKKHYFSGKSEKKRQVRIEKKYFPYLCIVRKKTEVKPKKRKIMKEKQVYILCRWVISEDDGPELQEPQVYTTFEKAASAAAKWMAQVETMLEDNGIKYECDYENWTISNSTDRWVARVQESVLR